jgi:reverse gyrase
MAERLEKMSDDQQKKDLEIKRLHSELNKSAANQMKAEMQAQVYNIIIRKFQHYYCGGGGTW